MFWLRCCGATSFRAVTLTILLALNAASNAQATQLSFAHGVTVPKALTLTFKTIDNPADPTFSQLLGINDAGVIVGNIGSGAAGHPNQAFASAPPYKTFVSLKLPGAITTRVTGIGDDGSMSGFWSPTSGLNDTNYGFLDWNAGSTGIFLDVIVNDPLVASVPPVDQVLTFNHGVAVGYYNDAHHLSHGFAYTVKTGTFTPVDISGATSVEATAMTEQDLTCGFFTKANAQTLGFLKLLSGGSPMVFQVAGSSTTEFLGVSDYAAVGFYVGANGVRHGLIYNLTKGVYTVVDDPNGTKGTTLNAINDAKQAVGYYKDSAGNTHGFLVSGF
jgi:hypothetical protein